MSGAYKYRPQYTQNELGALAHPNLDNWDNWECYHVLGQPYMYVHVAGQFKYIGQPYSCWWIMTDLQGRPLNEPPETGLVIKKAE
jgi:hypothetical protein